MTRLPQTRAPSLPQTCPKFSNQRLAPSPRAVSKVQRLPRTQWTPADAVDPPWGSTKQERPENVGPLRENQLHLTSSSARIVDEVVIDFYAAKKRLRARPVVWPVPPILAMLALADDFQRQIDSGLVNAAKLARANGMTRARISQILSLHKLASEIVMFLRGLSAGPMARLYSERRLRPLLMMSHARQLRAAAALVPGFNVKSKSRAS
jgi:hypothetical protein